MGTVYLLHFNHKMGRRQHYLGWTRNLTKRLEDHRLGRGGKTTAKYHAAGIGFEMAAYWPGSLDDEKRLKRRDIRILCPICKEKSMTVLEVMEQKADLTRKVVISLSDLTRETGNSLSKVRHELAALLSAGIIKVIRKGDASRNKTLYDISRLGDSHRTVPNDSAQHSVLPQIRIVEQDTNAFVDSGQLSTVSPHSHISVSLESFAQSSSSMMQALPRMVAMPPVLAHFSDLPGLGRCLDETGHYIVDFGLLNLGIRNPQWLPTSLHQGRLRVLHIPYCDSRVDDILHSLLFFFGDDLDANTCTRGENKLCRVHVLMDQLKAAFPSAEMVYDEPSVIGYLPEALYDVRRFCRICADLPVAAGLIRGLEFVPAQLPTTSGDSAPRGEEEKPPGVVEGMR